jgi:hypothetical protein
MPNGRRFEATIGDGSGGKTYLGKFDTAEEAALAFARARGPLEAKPAPQTAAEALRQAAAEGLTLERSDNAAGFRGVKRHGRRFEARIGDGSSGGHTHLGMFDTAEEAALAYARAREQEDDDDDDDDGGGGDDGGDDGEGEMETDEETAMAASEFNSRGVVCIDSWQRLDICCILSHRRLTDPTKTDATACRCLACCNHAQISDYVRKERKCPQCMSYALGVVRDDALRALLRGVSAEVSVVWVRNGKLRVDDPSPSTAPGRHRSRGKRARSSADVVLSPARSSMRLSAARVKIEST